MFVRPNASRLNNIILHLQYYAESHAVIYIVDSSDRDRIPDSKETFGKMRSSMIFNTNKFGWIPAQAIV